MRKVWLILPVCSVHIVALKLNASDETAPRGNPTALDKALMGLKTLRLPEALEGLVSKKLSR